MSNTPPRLDLSQEEMESQRQADGRRQWAHFTGPEKGPHPDDVEARLAIFEARAERFKIHPEAE